MYDDFMFAKKPKHKKKIGVFEQNFICIQMYTWCLNNNDVELVNILDSGCLYRECSYTENFFQPRLVSRFYCICHPENKNLFFNKYAAICK